MAVYDSLKGKVVVVTGAARGIGKATAIEFAKQGCHVGLITRRSSLDEVETAIRQENVPCCSVYAEVSQEDEVKKAVEKIGDTLGDVSILVNCAGGFNTKFNTLELSYEDWRQVMKDNLDSVFLCCKYFIPMMVKQGWGRVINISSEVGRTIHVITAPHYVAAKAGVIGYTRHLALEVATKGITVNSVAPGITLTERIEGRPPELREMRRQKIPLQRLSTPLEQAHAILFLASQEASYITGAVIDVNGGVLMM